MDLTVISLEDFLVSDPGDNIPSGPDRFLNVESTYSEHVGNIISDLGDRYTIHQFNNQAGDVLLLYDGKVVGGYVGESIDIDANHKGKGLSTPLILSAVPHRNLPSRRILSMEGRAALTKAWQVANGEKQSHWTT